jgi:hypothetical protein
MEEPLDLSLDFGLGLPIQIPCVGLRKMKHCGLLLVMIRLMVVTLGHHHVIHIGIIMLCIQNWLRVRGFFLPFPD